MRSYLEAVADRVVIFDGAMGTNIQLAGLGADDYGGPELEGCPEVLCDTHPDLIAGLHAAFFEAGVDVVETNSFGCSPITLAEYGIADRAEELARRSAELARGVADSFGGWVAGSIGPGTKFPSFGQIRLAELRDAYELQARGLLAGGVDLLLIETVFDLLQAKATILGCRRAMAAVGRSVPIQVQVTMETTGRMLPGSEIGAALTSLIALHPDVIGINCATGPREMSEHLRHLSSFSPVPISCLPNAGFPSVVDGAMHYDLTPEALADFHHSFVTELGVSVIGGCCGTTPEHLRQVVQRCRQLTPAPRQLRQDPGVASIFSHISYDQSPAFLAVGERANANGSKAFRLAMLADDLDACVRVGQDQVGEGAHVVDLCVDYVGRPGVEDMDALAMRFATAVSAAVMLDSTEPAVLEAGLQWMAGKAMLNSANLEDGEGPGTRFDKVMSMAAEYGAAVVCMCIDEAGQARTVARKLEIAERIAGLAVERYGMALEDLFFDCNALTVATGMEESRRHVETIEGIRAIKAALPTVHTSLGVSNVSFGLKPAARRVLNSVFLHECQTAGLDAAIVHPARILPLARIDPEHLKICLDLIWDRREPGYDPLVALVEAFELEPNDVEAAKEHRATLPVNERLRQRIIDGDRAGLEVDLEEALAAKAALDIVNDDLLSGMAEVGELFGSGRMQLPFVLQSAETMKAAVRYLEPHMERSGSSGKGTIVLATVKGDVHDIGKNLVDIILSNNGYNVHNLGIRVPLAEMVDRAAEVGADALGMSGLLVKSTLVMRENLEELNMRSLHHLPVILGGAALTRTYVERDLRQVYQGRVFYGKDAFEGLRTLERLMEMKRSGNWDPGFGRKPSEPKVERAPKVVVDPALLPSRSPEVASDNPVFVPPFLGTRVAKGIALDDIAQYLNQTALFRTQWGFRPQKPDPGDPGGKSESDADFKVRLGSLLRQQLAAAKSGGFLLPQVVYGYFAANGDGNELVVWEDGERSEEKTRFAFPRQSVPPYYCIADFFRPLESKEPDYVAFHIVTMGARVTEEALALKAADRYQDYLFLHGLGVEMTEALAELWHRRIREEWGFADEDGPSLAGLFRQQYRGGRYSWGYPACPDLEDNQRVAELLEAWRIGIEVGEETSYQFHPEQSTSAIICHHPAAKYFVV